jgi:ribose transport system substrate-binding protein
MKKTSKLIGITVVVLALLFAFAGCKVEGPEKAVEAAPAAQAAKTPKTGKDPSKLVFAVSLGWLENESGQRQRAGFEEAIKELGGTATYVDANYDAKKQSEQIEAIIKQNPDALFITPSDPVGITQAVQHAIDAGIPVFVSDSVIPGVKVNTTCTFDFYGGGYWAMDYLCQKLDGRGKIGFIDLPSNVAWDLIGQGAKWALKKYPNIEVVAKWSWDPTGATTPRQAIDNMLTKFPNKGDLDAIWCAWDGAAFEGVQAIKAVNREGEVLLVGCNGGHHCWEVMQASPSFIATAAESVYQMAYLCVFYAHQFNRGEVVPYLVITPGIGVTRDMLLSPSLPKNINLDDFDRPGVIDTLGWKRDF